MPHSNYKYGDIREDGYVWVGKRYNRGKRKDGTYPDDWRHPEAFKLKVVQNRANKKIVYDLIADEVNTYKIKRGCSHCGYNEKAVALDFHHTDRANKFLAVSSYWRTSMVQFKKIREEWKKCVVLCSNCHRIEEKRIRNEN